MENERSERHPRSAIFRFAAAVVAAMAYCLGVYALLESTPSSSGLISFSFLMLLPVAVCAFVAYVADPWGGRSLRSYAMVPLWILGAVVPLSLVLL